MRDKQSFSTNKPLVPMAKNNDEYIMSLVRDSWLKVYIMRIVKATIHYIEGKITEEDRERIYTESHDHILSVLKAGQLQILRDLLVEVEKMKGYEYNKKSQGTLKDTLDLINEKIEAISGKDDK